MKKLVDEGMEELSHCSVQGTTAGVWRKLLISCHPAPVFGSYSKMSHPRCVYINNRCGYQSITQQYLKKMFNKG